MSAASSAILDGEYRYVLTRQWGPRGAVGFAMLNPSTADATEDDATIRKCCGFARRWGFDGIRVWNVFALRSRDPLALRLHPDPVGPRNDDYLEAVIYDTDLFVAAWGQSWPKAYAPRVAEVGRKLAGRAVRIGALTASGQPRHPLMLAYATQREPWAS